MVRVRVVVTALVLAAALTACSVQTPPSVVPTPETTSAAQLAAAVPAEIRARGTLVIGTDATYAPNEFRDKGGVITGFDVELFDAIASRLNLKTQWQNSSFDGIIPGVRQGRFQVAVSSVSVTLERAKVVEMVPYYVAGTQWAARSGNKIGPANVCGRKVAVQADTIQVDDLAVRSAACQHAGQSAIEVQQYGGQGEATEAVLGGQADAMLADSPVTAYAVKQSDGRLVLSSAVYDSAYYGIVLPKGQADFAKLIGDTIDLLIADGTYAQIAAKWGLDPDGFRGTTQKA
ncbi:MAG: ABC transporter substrate-binding protein [Hamadaea sp.]|uniref:ABC transporter substrate-binding protein n=1 Tax=Hamadaea sp. TaxID=2024425 RepID=UPI0017F24D2B|nr:ABC transporter substrate-binding protein [Hamadaea sp.]NUR73002.1 ABC transporter substrate-binding protein [Hamadaea sp.]NUT18053.1 ABC transporter substrate-binding protein [Hamadaea sp.]